MPKRENLLSNQTEKEIVNPTIQFAPLWGRLFSYFLDWLFVGLPIFYITAKSQYLYDRIYEPFFENFFTPMPKPELLFALLWIFISAFGPTVLAVIVYRVLFLFRKQTTLSGMLFGLTLVDNKTHQSLPLRKVVIRELIGIPLVILSFGIGFLVAVRNSKKQCWQDSLVNSVVLKKPLVTALPLHIKPSIIVGVTVILLVAYSAHFLITNFSLGAVAQGVTKYAPVLEPGDNFVTKKKFNPSSLKRDTPIIYLSEDQIPTIALFCAIFDDNNYYITRESKCPTTPPGETETQITRDQWIAVINFVYSPLSRMGTIDTALLPIPQPSTVELENANLLKNLPGYIIVDKLDSKGKILSIPATGGEEQTLFDLWALQDSYGGSWTVVGSSSSFNQLFLQQISDELCVLDVSHSLWRYDVTTKEFKKLFPTEASELCVDLSYLASGAKHFYPYLSPNQKGIALTSSRAIGEGVQNSELYVFDTETYASRKLLSVNEEIVIKGWSVDSESLFILKGNPRFLSEQESQYNLVRVNIHSGEPKILTSDTVSALRKIVFSPTGGKFLRIADKTIEVVNTETLEVVRSYLLDDLKEEFNPMKAMWASNGKYITVEGTVPGNKERKGAILVMDETLRKIGLMYWALDDFDMYVNTLSPDGKFLIADDYTWYVADNRRLSSRVDENIGYKYGQRIAAWIKKLP